MVIKVTLDAYLNYKPFKLPIGFYGLYQIFQLKGEIYG